MLLEIGWLTCLKFFSYKDQYYKYKITFNKNINKKYNYNGQKMTSCPKDLTSDYD